MAGENSTMNDQSSESFDNYWYLFAEPQLHLTGRREFEMHTLFAISTCVVVLLFTTQGQSPYISSNVLFDNVDEVTNGGPSSQLSPDSPIYNGKARAK